MAPCPQNPVLASGAAPAQHAVCNAGGGDGGAQEAPREGLRAAALQLPLRRALPALAVDLGGPGEDLPRSAPTTPTGRASGKRFPPEFGRGGGLRRHGARGRGAQQGELQRPRGSSRLGAPPALQAGDVDAGVASGAGTNPSGVAMSAQSPSSARRRVRRRSNEFGRNLAHAQRRGSAGDAGGDGGGGALLEWARGETSGGTMGRLVAMAQLGGLIGRLFITLLMLAAATSVLTLLWLHPATLKLYTNAERDLQRNNMLPWLLGERVATQLGGVGRDFGAKVLMGRVALFGALAAFVVRLMDALPSHMLCIRQSVLSLTPMLPGGAALFRAMDAAVAVAPRAYHTTCAALGQRVVAPLIRWRLSRMTPAEHQQMKQANEARQQQSSQKIGANKAPVAAAAGEEGTSTPAAAVRRPSAGDIAAASLMTPEFKEVTRDLVSSTLVRTTVSITSSALYGAAMSLWVMVGSRWTNSAIGALRRANGALQHACGHVPALLTWVLLLSTLSAYMHVFGAAASERLVSLHATLARGDRVAALLTISLFPLPALQLVLTELAVLAVAYAVYMPFVSVTASLWMVWMAVVVLSCSPNLSRVAYVAWDGMGGTLGGAARWDILRNAARLALTAMDPRINLLRTNSAFFKLMGTHVHMSEVQARLPRMDELDSSDSEGEGLVVLRTRSMSALERRNSSSSQIFADKHAVAFAAALASQRSSLCDTSAAGDSSDAAQLLSKDSGENALPLRQILARRGSTGVVDSASSRSSLGRKALNRYLTEAAGLADAAALACAHPAYGSNADSGGDCTAAASPPLPRSGGSSLSTRGRDEAVGFDRPRLLSKLADPGSSASLADLDLSGGLVSPDCARSPTKEPMSPPRVPRMPSVGDYIATHPGAAPEGVLAQREACVSRQSSIISARRTSIKSMSSVASIKSISSFASDSSDVADAAEEVEFVRVSPRSANFALKDFDHVCCIGAGGFSTVFLMRHRELGVLSAVKCIDKESAVANGLMVQVQNEGGIHSEAEHPFVSRMLFAQHDARNIYFGVEFVQGGDLLNLVQTRGSLGEDTARFYAACLVLALEYLHEQGVAFRDLKPENVMVDQFGYPTLIDFGLARLMGHSSRRARTQCGTLQYMAPETILGKWYTQQVDWWALGVCMYVLLAGRLPFEGSTAKELVSSILNDDITYSSRRFSVSAKSLLSNFLCRDPAQRWGTAQLEQIKAHPFFMGIKWDDLLARRVRPPYSPALSGDDDLSYFGSTVDYERRVEVDDWGEVATWDLDAW